MSVPKRCQEQSNPVTYSTTKINTVLSTITSVPIRTSQRVAEISWFSDLCGGDTQYLGVLDNERRANFAHSRDIVLNAERLGFSNVLLPSAYTVGQDVLSFANGVAPLTSTVNLLTAIRTGELHPPMLARAIACLDHLLKGRLTINIINSDLPGLRENPALRYQRCSETIEILRQAWTQERIQYRGDLYQFDLPADPAKPYQQNGGPLLYFGGTSEGARDVCARHCDMFLMWPETEESMYETMLDMSARAAVYGRKLDFGLRIHVIPRETEKEAKGYVRKLMSKFDEQRGLEIRSRSEDSRSLGVVRQDRLRDELADDEGYIEPLLWTGIGKVFSGCGGALVGDPDQIVGKLNRYMDMGFRSFVFSGFPLIEEANEFSRWILHRLPNAKMSVLQGRTPATEPVTPLTTANLR